MSKDVLWSDCRECKGSTKHTILGNKNKEQSPDIYHCETKYFLVECNGCETISFRKELHDYEAFYQIGPTEYEHPITTEIFPHYIHEHTPIESLYDIPDVVSSIYKESLLAIQEGAFTLAGLGLRATIEAICNNKEIKGRNLQVRINAMNRSGMISKSDADRLHAIRFMGNDAAHEIKKAKKKSVLIALKIIEHILLSVYIFEKEVNKHLETPITTIEEALVILQNNIKSMEINTTFTLAKWLGKSKRRILDNIAQAQIESDLIDKINASEVEGITLIDTPDSITNDNSQWYKKIEIAV